MNPTQTNSHLTTDCPTLTEKGDSCRCQHRYSNGKRCRLSSSESQLGLCSHHFRLSAAGASGRQSPSDSLDLSADLLPELSGSGVRADLRQFLTRLLVLVTQGRVTPRRASVLAYITNQLLHSHRASTSKTRPATTSCKTSAALTQLT